MANSDLMRIRTNVLARGLLDNLRQVNANLATHQLRLGTGQRINGASDDPAGLTISSKLRASYRVWDALYDNAGQAKNMLAVAEGGLMEISSILTTMNEKIVTAASDSLGSEERRAISQQLTQLRDEINDIASQTEFNGVALLDQTRTFKFTTAPRAQTTWTSAPYDTTTLEMANLNALTTEDSIDSTNYTDYYDEVEAAISTVSAGLTAIGSLTNRLTAKENVISVARNNTEAAYHRIFNADMAEEQIEVTKLQILQQTTLQMMAQANLNSRAVLTLFD